ncbi:glutathione-disulfide reductase [Caenimonas koreensis DSM 17982]|uniref:Glutathione-disulfide reductase n=1 Tax=Caenimonas koreensis DSM 17982 TaxID=1121255 RepID=A0A844AY16_9BURK|nr:glutathione-disulfide reductase [Caenimonas koreensis]MRD49440.1 glutathione-disulfide reductase [Caenimonas koreensis DSM 17982]
MAQFDLFVIGAGSAGVRAARMAAQRGARVAVAEAAALGGTCVNVGCVPKKLYSYAAHFADDFRDAAGFGWHLPPATFDWAVLKKNRAAEITRLNGIYENLLTGAGAQIVTGWASVVDANTVRVQTAAGVESFSAKHILIATGGQPSVPQFPGREFVVSSDSMFDLETFPRRLLVVGGGYIACEFASIFNGLGSQVTQLYRGEQILRGFDDEVRAFIAQEVRKHGVDLRVGSDVQSVEKTSSGLVATLVDGSTIEADTVLYATGRVPNVAALGLDSVGVERGASGAIVVDEHYVTSVKSILAIGDVTARMQLTPVALAEAMVVVDRLFGAGKRDMSYEFISTAVFTHPSIGTVGYGEAQARETFGRITVYRSEFKSLKHTLSGSSERTLMKLIVEDATDRVVGLHMVGADAGEVVQGFAVAMKAGATKAVFDSTIGIHPTMAEEFVTMRTAVVY